MKKSIFIFLAALSCSFFSCNNDATWPAGEEQYEHAYYIGFQDWGKLDNKLTFTVAKGATIAIPVQFFSERVRNYDVTTKYYVATNALLGTANAPALTGTNAAVLGTDYQIVDSLSNVLTPDATGAYTITWPKALKGVKNIYVKNITTKTTSGSFYVTFFDPADLTGITYTHRMNDSTANYTVSAFTQSFCRKVTVSK
jgi:hypothetical protein